MILYHHCPADPPACKNQTIVPGSQKFSVKWLILLVRFIWLKKVLVLMRRILSTTQIIIQIFMMMDFWPPISLGQHTLLFRASNFTYTLTQNEEIQPKNSRAYADLRLVLRNVSKQGIESQSALRFYTQDSIPMFHHNSCMCFSISFLILTREETVLDSDAFYLVSSTCIK